LSVAGLAAVPAASSAHNYPSSIDRAFLNACTKSAQDQGASRSKARRYCVAALDCIDDKLTLRQFKAADEATRAGRKSRYDKVIAGCVRQAGGQLS
jgi:hypothetical protein